MIRYSQENNYRQRKLTLDYSALGDSLKSDVASVLQEDPICQEQAPQDLSNLKNCHLV